jgi:hypothetical protein
MHRGGRGYAAQLLRSILANDERPVTAHDVLDAQDALPLDVRCAGQRRAMGVRNRRADYARWCDASSPVASAAREAPAREVSLSQSLGDEMDL